jgi:hypothetical protein
MKALYLLVVLVLVLAEFRPALSQETIDEPLCVYNNEQGYYEIAPQLVEPADAYVVVFIDEDYSIVQFNETLQRIAASVPLTTASFDVIAIGPRVGVKEAASIITQLRPEAIVAAGASGHKSCMAAAAAALMHVTLARSRLALPCTSAKIGAFYSESAYNLASLRRWAIPLTVAGHWTEGRPDGLNPELVYIPALSAFHRAELLGSTLLVEKLSVGRTILIPGSCVGDNNNNNVRSLPTDKEMFPFAVLAETVSTEAASLLDSGKMVHMGRAAKFCLCVESDRVAPPPVPRSQAYIGNTGAMHEWVVFGAEMAVSSTMLITRYARLVTGYIWRWSYSAGIALAPVISRAVLVIYGRIRILTPMQAIIIGLSSVVAVLVALLLKLLTVLRQDYLMDTRYKTQRNDGGEEDEDAMDVVPRTEIPGVNTSGSNVATTVAGVGIGKNASVSSSAQGSGGGGGGGTMGGTTLISTSEKDPSAGMW